MWVSVLLSPQYPDFILFQPSEPSGSCPSLAIVLLPSVPSISLGVHTLYLPIVVPSPMNMVDVFASTDYLLDAEQQWESLGIPSDRLTSLSDWSTAVVDQEKLEAASPSQFNTAFRPLLGLRKHTPRKVFSTNAILYVPRLFLSCTQLLMVLLSGLPYFLSLSATSSKAQSLLALQRAPGDCFDHKAFSRIDPSLLLQPRPFPPSFRTPSSLPRLPKTCRYPW